MKNVLIIGIGEFGKHLANKLISLENEVRMIDSDDSVVGALPGDYGDVLVGDCRNINVIGQLGVQNYDICVVSVGGNFQASLEITSNLKESGAKYIISQCQSDIQAKFLKMAGADKTVYAEREAAEKTAFLCNEDRMIDYIAISDDYKIVKMMLPKPWAGHTLPELSIRPKLKLNILAVEHASKVIVPDINYVFDEKDMVLILGDEKQLAQLRKL